MNTALLSEIQAKKDQIRKLEREISRLENAEFISDSEKNEDNLYELIFRQMQDAYILVDSDYLYIDSNINAKKLFRELYDFEKGQRITENMYSLFSDGADDCWLGNSYYEKKVVKIKKDNRVMGYAMLLDDDTDLQTKVLEKTLHIQLVQDSIITGMASVVESRDNSTGGHIMRTKKVVQIFAEKLLDYTEEFGISIEFLRNVVKSAPMHDIGKIAVDDVVLRKPGRFTDEEYQKMKAHSGAGAEMLKKILSEVDNREFVTIAVNVAGSHHERWDGKGYPKGIKGEEIPLEARIMALADVFDALVSKRCYKEAYGYDRAFRIIEEGTGTQFDPSLVPLFIECRKKLEKLYDEMD